MPTSQWISRFHRCWTSWQGENNKCNSFLLTYTLCHEASYQLERSKVDNKGIQKWRFFSQSVSAKILEALMNTACRRFVSSTEPASALTSLNSSWRGNSGATTLKPVPSPPIRNNEDPLMLLAIQNTNKGHLRGHKAFLFVIENQQCVFVKLGICYFKWELDVSNYKKKII